MNNAELFHPSAEVSPRAIVGDGTRIWHQAQVREGARIGRQCVLGKGVYVDVNVVIGDYVKIQNGCYIYNGATLEDGVFLGPGVIFTNDKVPRAINPNGSLKTIGDWKVGRILVKRGASIGAGTILLPDTVIGTFAMAGVGSVITKDVPDHGLVVGNPARLIGFVCSCGARLPGGEYAEARVKACCARCGCIVTVPIEDWKRAGNQIRAGVTGE